MVCLLSTYTGHITDRQIFGSFYYLQTICILLSTKHQAFAYPCLAWFVCLAPLLSTTTAPNLCLACLLNTYHRTALNQTPNPCFEISPHLCTRTTAPAPPPHQTPSLRLFACLFVCLFAWHRTRTAPRNAHSPPARLGILFLQKCLTYWEPAPYPCLAPNTAPNLALTEIDIQSQKPALPPYQAFACLFIPIPAPPYPCLAPLLCTLA